jgi:hypothetical protein
MTTIQLDLGNGWYYFDAQRLRAVRERQTFSNGDLLYSGNAFYELRKRVLRPIRRNKAAKLVYRKTRNPRIAGIVRRSRDPVTALARDYKKVLSKRRVGRLEARKVCKLTPQERAQAFFAHVVEAYGRLWVEGEKLVVRSRNRRTYRISLDSGQVSDTSGAHVCVIIRSRERLPQIDIILAKALTIAYTPQLIYTLD